MSGAGRSLPHPRCVAGENIAGAKAKKVLHAGRLHIVKAASIHIPLWEDLLFIAIVRGMGMASNFIGKAIF